MLDTAEPLDALFTVNSLLVVGARQALRERELVIPDDVALVTFDETPGFLQQRAASRSLGCVLRSGDEMRERSAGWTSGAR
jgi:DNA-binding LacI/PurR family transcriptional regulator